jgi:hypothetical protein
MTLKEEVQDVLDQLEWWPVSDTFFGELACETTQDERFAYGDRFYRLLENLEEFALGFWDEPESTDEESA